MSLALTHIPTGRGDAVLCLQAQRHVVWAGLYPKPEAGAPLEIGIAARRTGVRTRGNQLLVGDQSFPFHHRTYLRRALLWLDQQGVRITTEVTR